MARIRQFITGTRDVSAHPTEVDAEVQIVDAGNGRRLLQVSTLGSDLRKSQPKVSQTIQIDEDRARELRDLLEKTFAL